MPSARVERAPRMLIAVNQIESPSVETTAPPPVDGREGTTLLKFQFVIFSGLLALLVPGPRVLGTGPLSDFYWAAVAMHLVFSAWLFMGAPRLLAASLAVTLPVLGTPWLVLGLDELVGLPVLLAGPVVFAVLLLAGVVIGRKLAAPKAD